MDALRLKILDTLSHLSNFFAQVMINTVIIINQLSLLRSNVTR